MAITITVNYDKENVLIMLAIASLLVAAHCAKYGIYLKNVAEMRILYMPTVITQAAMARPDATLLSSNAKTGILWLCSGQQLAQQNPQLYISWCYCIW